MTIEELRPIFLAQCGAMEKLATDYGTVAEKVKKLGPLTAAFFDGDPSMVALMLRLERRVRKAADELARARRAVIRAHGKGMA
jgi:hypothetical protein